MECKCSDVCSYLLALDFDLFSEVGNIRMYENANEDIVIVGTENTHMSDKLLNEVLSKIDKTRKDLELYVNGN